MLIISFRYGDQILLKNQSKCDFVLKLYLTFVNTCFQQVREATKSDTVDPRLAVLLDRISEYSNVPRKKAKFQVSNTLS